MRKPWALPLILLSLVWLDASFAADVTNPQTLSNAVQSFGGLQMALTQSSLGTPGGTMAGYVVGDTVTLSCTGVVFSTAPVIGVTTQSGGSATSAIVVNPGVTSNSPASGALNCSQASTSGSGTGLTIAATLGVIAAYVTPSSLLTGGAANDGNFFLNWNPADASPNIVGAENTLIGTKSGRGFAAGGTSSFNTCLGHNACGDGGTAALSSNNVMLGSDAGRNMQGSVSNGSNVFVGSGAARNSAAGFSTIVGASAGGVASNTPGNFSGSANTMFGFQAGNAVTSGGGNLFLGVKSGDAITTGSFNIILQAQSGADACSNGNESNVIAACAGAGRVWTATGGGTPSTSVTTFAGVIVSAGITTDATHTDATVCEDTTTHQFYFGSGTAGICLGTSSSRFKHDIRPLEAGLEQIAALEPVAYRLNADHGDPNKLLYGFTAEQGGKVLPALTGEDAEGKPNTFDYIGVVPVLVNAVKQLKAENDDLRACNDNWKCRLFGWR